MTPEPPDGLYPLRGPLGVRELFFTRRASPILAYIKLGTAWMVRIGLVSVVLLALVGWFYAMIRVQQYGVTGTLFAWCLLAWIGFEVLCVLLGLNLHGLAAASGRRRLSDLALTALRPIEICQWTLARRCWTMAFFTAFLFGGTMLFHALMLRKHLYFIVLIGAVGVNTTVTFYMTQWMQAALFLSAPSKTAALRRQFVFFMLYALICSFFMVGYVALIMIVFSSRQRNISDPMLAWLVLPLILPFWWMKYRIARAWAERIERAIFYRVDL